MKNLRLLPASVALASLVLAPLTAFAAKGEGPKAKAMAKYDLNHDGKLDDAEIAALQKDFAADPKGELSRFDLNKDGKLSKVEMAKHPMAAHFPMLDTDKSGYLSPQEAAAHGL